MRSTNGFCRVALLVLSVAVATPLTVSAAQYHVANGAANCSDSNTGTEAMPFQTIGMAASIMQAGDTVLVHSGTYREWVNPPRGGNSEGARITYKAYPGDHVVIKGSERITSWTLVSGNVYKSDVPNSLFGSYNPFATLLYDPNGYLTYGTGYHLGAVYVNGTPYVEQLTASAVTNSARTFYAEVGTSTTTIYINYSGSSTPSNDLTEINVRESVVRSSGTGRNYITIDGFAICHGAPQWASCAGSQTGMIVINSGNSWLIQNCRISDARTCGITGHGTANVVRNNIIERCGQCGIVGNGGGWFAGLIEGNIIQDINPGDQFGGHETAGIKCHGVVDLTIRNNIFRRITASKVSGHGIWLDYATQGCRVSGNIFYPHADVKSACDLYIEVSHAPHLVDNNIFVLTGNQSASVALKLITEGAIVVHNLFVGAVDGHGSNTRETAWYIPHTKWQAGSGVSTYTDDKYYNNIFLGGNNSLPQGDGYACDYNVYLQNASKCSWGDANGLVNTGYQANFQYQETANGVTVGFNMDPAALSLGTPLITRSFIGLCRPANQGIENHDGSAITVDVDMLGNPRDPTHPAVGPLENLQGGANSFTFIRGTASGGVPLPPIGLSATAGAGEVGLRWSASVAVDAVSYNVKRSTSSGGPYTTIATGITNVNYTDTGLLNGTTYYYVVAARNAAVEGSNSVEVVAIPFHLSSREPVADAYVRDGSYAGENHGRDLTLIVKLTGTSYTRETFLRFDAAGLAQMQSVKLRMMPATVGTDGATTTFALQMVGNNKVWNEDLVTWSNKPAGSGGVLASVTGFQVNQPVEVDVTAQARAAAAGDGFLALRMYSTTDGGNRGVDFCSREDSNPARRPVLVSTQPVPTLSTLSPANNAAGVAIGADLAGTFSEDVQINDVGGITLTSVSGGVTVAATVSVAGRTVTINPNANLAYSTTYAVQIAASSVRNAAGNFFAGIANTTTWRFTTGAAPPAITATAAFTSFTTTFGTPSAAQSCAVTGTSLTAAISVAAVIGFEFSTNGGSTYASTATIPQSGGNAGGTLYVRLTATAPVGTYNGKNIALSSSGASSVNVTTSASGNTVVSPFDGWAVQAPSGQRGRTDDPDKDGQNNLLEFALDGSPSNGANNAKVFSYAGPAPAGYGFTGNVMILTIAVRNNAGAFTGPAPYTAVDAVDGIRYTIQGGTNLNDWGGTVFPFIAASYPGLPVPGTDYHYQSFALTGSQDLPGKGFLRVKVEPYP